MAFTNIKRVSTLLGISRLCALNRNNSAISEDNLHLVKYIETLMIHVFQSCQLMSAVKGKNFETKGANSRVDRLFWKSSDLPKSKHQIMNLN